MTVSGAQIAAQATSHLGEPSPDDSCMSNGLERWTRELGLAGLDTASVSEGKARALQGYHGWSYHQNTAGIRVGDFADWDPEVLGSPEDRHVSCVVDINGHGAIKTVGSGGPTGKVAYQPRGGGYNPPDYFRGFFRAPASAPAARPAPQAAPKPASGSSSSSSSSSDYTVQPGDDLIRIAAAHHTTVPAILRANPVAADHVTRNFHITRANLILAGQKIHLP